MRAAVYAVVAVGLLAGTVYAGFNFGISGAVKSQRKEAEKEILKKELVNAPSTPTGSTSGIVGLSYTYSTGGASSTLKHTVEYRFNWGDGMYSAWSIATSAFHSWSTAGAKTVTAEVRCQTHPTVTNISTPLNVAIQPSETVSIPSTPTGTTSGTTLPSYIYNTGSASSNLGHPVEYRFNWGDGTYSVWSTATSAFHSWSMAGAKTVVAEARCQIHPTVTTLSSVLMVTIVVPSITTVAGTGALGYNGDSIDATTAQLNFPRGIFVDSSDHLYIADSGNNRIRKVDAITGLISTVAGTGVAGFNGDDIAATAADLDDPFSVCVANSGDLYITDKSNHRIRKVDVVTGKISTVAGTGAAGFNGDGIAATTAQLFSPQYVAVDSNGNMYIADSSNSRIRKVDAVSGLISTVAGTGVDGFNGDGIVATAAQLFAPSSIVVDSSGDVYIVDQDNLRIRKVNVVTGLISTVAGTGVEGYNGDGIAATAAQLNFPFGILVDSSGDLYIGDFVNQRIRKVDAVTGLISTVAGTGVQGFNGDGIVATTAQLNKPYDVFLDSSGRLYITDASNHRIRRVP